MVELTEAPAISLVVPTGDRTRGRSEMVSRRAAVRAQQIRVRQSVSQVATVLESVELVANAFIVRGQDIEALRAIPGVARVLPVHELRPLLDAMSTIHRVPEAVARIGGPSKAGAGIKIGIFDTGIAASHAGFQDDSLPVLDGYPKLSNEEIRSSTSKKIIVGRSYDSLSGGEVNLDIEDRVGHGTAVAMVAAGVTTIGPLGAITGFAPKAYLGIYRLFGGSSRTTLPSSVILKALDDAVADGMDIVNMSFGSPFALTPDMDIVRDAAERASSTGMILVMAGGNSGPDAYTLGTSNYPSAVVAGASYNARQFGASVILSDETVIGTPGNGQPLDQPVTGRLMDVTTVTDSEGKLCESAPKGAFTDKIVLIYRGECTFEMKLNNAQSAGAVGAVVYSSQASPNRVIMIVDSATLPAIMVDYSEGLKLKERLKTTPSLATLQFTTTAFTQSSNRLGAFSSRGPSIDAAIKPDLVAVGTDVSTVTESRFPEGEDYDKLGYKVVAGSSFSAAATSGAMALLKSGHPGLNSDQYRSLLVNSASPLVLKDESTATVMSAGSGLLNVDAAVRSTTALSPISASFGIGDGNPDRNKAISVTNLSKSKDTFRISISTNDSTAAVADSQVLEIGPGETKLFNLSFKGNLLSRGEYQGFVTVMGDNSFVPARMAYWYGSTDGEPASVSIINQDFVSDVNATATFDIVLSDPAGMPVIGGKSPQITSVSGGGQVLAILSQEPVYPGVWEVTVRLGPTEALNVFRVQLGKAKRDITIEGQ